MRVTNVMDSLTKEVGCIVIELMNGNKIEINEISEHTIQFRNITSLTGDLGLNLYTVDYSAIDITPEG